MVTKNGRVEVTFVIKRLPNEDYYTGNESFTRQILRAKEYSTYTEAEEVVKNVLPKAIYQIDKLFIKETIEA